MSVLFILNMMPDSYEDLHMLIHFKNYILENEHVYTMTWVASGGNIEKFSYVTNSLVKIIPAINYRANMIYTNRRAVYD